MNDTTFFYVTYIRTTPAALWDALTGADFQRRYWFGSYTECDWQVGSPWTLRFADGRIADSGAIVEADPPKRLVIRWRNEWKPELAAEGDARCTMELEPTGQGSVKLTITHTIDRPASKFIAAVSGGWPLILSNLKSLLETGEVAVPAKQ